MLFRNGWYPPEIKSTNLDFDWIYRRPLDNLTAALNNLFIFSLGIVKQFKQSSLNVLSACAYQAHGPKSPIARGASVGNMVIWVAVLLSACLIFYYF